MTKKHFFVYILCLTKCYKNRYKHFTINNKTNKTSFHWF